MVIKPHLNAVGYLSCLLSTTINGWAFLPNICVSVYITISAVYAESCSAPADCSATTCDSNAELHCIDGLCTCTTAGSGDGKCILMLGIPLSV